MPRWRNAFGPASARRQHGHAVVLGQVVVGRGASGAWCYALDTPLRRLSGSTSQQAETLFEAEVFQVQHGLLGEGARHAEQFQTGRLVVDWGDATWVILS